MHTYSVNLPTVTLGEAQDRGRVSLQTQRHSHDSMSHLSQHALEVRWFLALLKHSCLTPYDSAKSTTQAAATHGTYSSLHCIECQQTASATAVCCPASTNSYSLQHLYEHTAGICDECSRWLNTGSAAATSATHGASDNVRPRFLPPLQ